jgi:hypothetical protein
MSQAEISEIISASISQMTRGQRQFFHAIRIYPEKWKAANGRDTEERFWVVGVIGQRVIWYNEIEEGFNVSPYQTYGAIEELWCNQDKLEWVVQALLDQATGSRT